MMWQLKEAQSAEYKNVYCFQDFIFYHDCIRPVPHDTDANFRVELYVNCTFFHLYSCIVKWHFDTGK